VNVVTASAISQRLAVGPVRPTPADLEPLAPIERRLVRLVEGVLRTPVLERLSRGWLWHFNRRLVNALVGNLLQVRGTEVFRDLPADRGLLICSNHRSFFDQYVIMACFANALGRLPPLYFPVRSDYFYEGVGGGLVNGLAAAFHMYPPVFRDPRKRAFNRYTQARLVELLRTPGTAVGVHPEGRRGKGPDPYELLPAQVGVGQLILEARPSVVPVFINGLGNDLWRQSVSNFRRNGTPIVLVVGSPLVLPPEGVPSRLRTHKDVADQVLDAIRELGQRERRLRAELAARGPAEQSA
jgi:1-acyl-sn-glycerol-3-phosphate acyltransferase